MVDDWLDNTVAVNGPELGDAAKVDVELSVPVLEPLTECGNPEPVLMLKVPLASEICALEILLTVAVLPVLINGVLELELSVDFCVLMTLVLVVDTRVVESGVLGPTLTELATEEVMIMASVAELVVEAPR